MNILVINCGSSSVKYQVLDTDTEAVLKKGKIERVGQECTHTQAVQRLLEDVTDHSIDAIGHRVVHGGEAFSDSQRLDDDAVAAIEGCVPLAPLHNPANLAGIRAAREALPSVTHVAVFDTAFHHRLPRRARTYAIDPQVAAEHGIRRYGFHGPSHAYVAQKAADYLETPLEALRIITCHLGNGASVCAVEFGHSVETSMGMTPLEGLVMGSRSGDLDPGAVLTLLRDGSRTAADVDRMLNRDSGLKGLSGVSNDVRDIEASASEGDDRARMAIAVFTHRARKYIGAYAAVMGGVDVLVMTAGIGENSASMRRRILQRFEYLGLRLDEDKNQEARVSEAHPAVDISAKNSRVRALVVATNEELMIARETARVAGGKKDVADAGPIPVAVSARHAHLNQETFEQLFGPGATLTKYKDISQPGQFASEETVSLIGPRSRIDGVRILGPLRPRNQIEIARTDEFRLGVDAPVRRSGQVDGSAPITLEGPKGKVTLEEGLVCAWRHIHMTPADAARYGVTDGDEVEVSIIGGPRDLIFGDVLVRVKPNYALEMHIDTDEANAAELPARADAQLVDSQILDAAKACIRRRRAQHD